MGGLSVCYPYHLHNHPKASISHPHGIGEEPDKTRSGGGGEVAKEIRFYTTEGQDEFLGRKEVTWLGVWF